MSWAGGSPSSGGFDAGTPPPYVPGGDTGVAPRPGRGRRTLAFVGRHWLGGVAVLLVLAIGLGITWYIALDGMPEGLLGSSDEKCQASVEGVRRELGAAFGGPADDTSQDVRDAMAELAARPAWALDVYSSSSPLPPDEVPPEYDPNLAEPEEPRALAMSVELEGDTVQFRRDGGKVLGVIDGEDSWVRDSDSWFWVEACPNTLFLPMSTGRPDCSGRRTDGDDVVVSVWSPVGDEPDECDAGPDAVGVDEVGIRIDLRLREGRLRGVEFRLRSETRTYLDEYLVTAGHGIDTPLPGQRIPSWFVGLVS